MQAASADGDHMQGVRLLLGHAQQLAECLGGPAARTHTKHRRRSVSQGRSVPIDVHVGRLVLELIGASKAAGDQQSDLLLRPACQLPVGWLCSATK